ncbi:hypothetical protein CROQUDRAFT_725879 [Cronartium quercuum f. sp. fusiforme G11]|uniref:Major facilitator superfamily (MFS) profile domain-containing protein n=1 Tax=Cronartium quercuum f. sp. fusiforme G11 TaxID=708437 RepID=A0A9P6NBG2_9BASI|nr:hypothetical protein CROQUDRAFT_725879 [Cronartium quercuum f. sp. fusiforme G11]
MPPSPSSHSDPKMIDLRAPPSPQLTAVNLKATLKPLQNSSTYQAEFEVGWDGEEDPENPRSLPPFRRWIIILLGALLAFNVSFSSSAPALIYPQIVKNFEISPESSVLNISLFLAGYCAGPLAWGPLSEIYGRRIVFLVAFTPYTLSCIACALAPNFRILLTFRFLSGLFGAAPLSNAGALIADVLEASQRGIGLGIFSLAPFAGPALGPVVSGTLESAGISWRWVYWISSIIAAISWILLLIGIPETYPPIILKRKALRMRQETGDRRYWASLEKEKSDTMRQLSTGLIKPFKLLFREPMLLVITIYTSFVNGILYLTFEALPMITTGVHHFNYSRSGFAFIPLIIGGLLAHMIYVYYHAPRYQFLCRECHPYPVPPEERLGPAKLAAILFPISIFWLGWSGNYESVHWSVPLLAVVVLGMVVLSSLLSLYNYIIDTYLQCAATALAINIVVRSTFGAVFPIFAKKMFERLGINWAASVLGSLALIGMPIPFVFYQYGAQIRALSKTSNEYVESVCRKRNVSKSDGID